MENFKLLEVEPINEIYLSFKIQNVFFGMKNFSNIDTETLLEIRSYMYQNIINEYNRKTEEIKHYNKFIDYLKNKLYVSLINIIFEYIDDDPEMPKSDLMKSDINFDIKIPIYLYQCQCYTKSYYEPHEVYPKVCSCINPNCLDHPQLKSSKIDGDLHPICGKLICSKCSMCYFCRLPPNTSETLYLYYINKEKEKRYRIRNLLLK